MAQSRPMVRQPASKLPNLQKKHLKQLQQKSGVQRPRRAGSHSSSHSKCAVIFLFL